jgi:pimeloyl-ACP methyl ester carboxylesterase
VPTVRTDDGVELAAYDFGGEGRDVLFAHATGFHAHVWLPVVERLRHRFHCWAFDERGHGDSTSPPDGDFDWRAFGRDALAVVAALGLERPFGVGHSAGGALLLLAEADVPGTLAAAYCYEPVMAPVDDPPAPFPGPLSEGARRRREVFADRDEARERYRAKRPFSLFAPDALEAYIVHGFDDLPDGRVRLKCRGEDEARAYEHGFSHDLFRRLSTVACPVAVDCGAETDAFGIDLCQRYAARLPHGRAQAVPGLGHFGPLEAPDVIADRIAAAFLPG